jgi:hypothetical protein
MTGLGGPTLLQVLSEAVSLHRDFQQSQARPASPRMLGKRAVAQAQAGDFKSAAATMREIERHSELDKYDPQQARDDQGRWTTGSGSSSSSDQALDAAAARIVSATAEMEAGARGLCEATDDESRTRHATTLARAAAAMHHALAELPDLNVDQVTPSSRSALAAAGAQLRRVREQLHQCGILGKRLDPADADDDEDYATARRKVGEHLARERVLAEPRMGKSAAPLTILKRIDEPEEAAMDYSTIEKLEAEADRLLKRVNQALGEDLDDEDDATVEDDWSEPADAKAKGNNASNDDDGDSEPDEDDDENDVWNLHLTKDEKFLDRGRGHSNMGPVRINERFPPDPHQLGFVDVVGQGKRHKFDSRIDLVQERDGVSRAEAMSRARQEFPETYSDFQNWLAEQPTNQQHMRRSWGNDSRAAKRAPETFESLCADQMAKGCVYEVAAQRVMQTHGSNALRHRALGPRSDPARLTKRLETRIDEVVADTGLSRTEALRALRKSGEYYW